MSPDKSVSQAMDHVKDAASAVRESFFDLGERSVKLLDAARLQRVRAIDSALEQIGLQRRQSALRPVLFFVAGVIVAGSVVFLIAPTAGQKLRTRIARLFGTAAHDDEVRAASTDRTSIEHSVDGAVGDSTNSGGDAGRHQAAGDRS